MSTAYVIFTGLYLAAVLIRDVYELLKKTRRIDTSAPRLFAVVFASMCVMWVSWFAMGFVDPTRVPMPQALRWTGLGAVILGFGLVLGGMWQLKGVENIDHLVTDGLFSRIRHPMYVGFVLLILGWSAYQGSVTSLAVGSLGMLSILWWRDLEERDMLSSYGAAYADYRARTWF
jgi:protein-S-isoprenylcysteine O-methyltransferase Ste14